MHVVNLIQANIVHVNLRFAHYHISFALFFHMFEEHGVNSIILLHSSDDILPGKTEMFGIVVPGLLF